MRSIPVVECAGDRYEIDGHLGYLLLPGPRLREVVPEVCPHGHRGVRVTVGWGNDCRTVNCSACWQAGLPRKTAYYCPCRAAGVSAERPSIPPDQVPMHPDPDAVWP